MRTCANLSFSQLQLEDLRYPDAVAVLLAAISSTTNPPTPVSLLDLLLVGLTLSSSAHTRRPAVAVRPGKPVQEPSVSRLVLPLHLRLSAVQGLGGEVEEVLEVDSAEVHGGGGGVLGAGTRLLRCTARHSSGWRCVAARQEYTDTLRPRQVGTFMFSMDICLFLVHGYGHFLVIAEKWLEVRRSLKSSRGGIQVPPAEQMSFSRTQKY